MEKWFIKNKAANFEAITKVFNISEFLARLLVNRDINTPRLIDSYLNLKFEKLNDPFMLKDMDKALDLILKIKEEQSKIRIIGDYDVDGVMSTVILKTALDLAAIDCDYRIPNRVEDGYGINKEMIDQAKADGISCIITCDNGIAALEEVEYARKLGLSIIVTDHHELPVVDGKEVLARAHAVINPKRSDCPYPFDLLCGAAICFKLAQALYKSLAIEEDKLMELLEYAALATVCDVVDLVDENRILVSLGLERLNNSSNLGLRSLIDACDLKDKEISIYHLGFIIGPCINASGRLDTAMMAIELFLSSDLEKTNKIARELKDLNDKRKEMTQAGLDRVVDQIETSPIKDQSVLVVYDPDIHESIAGIIAGRVKDKYHKPSLVLTNGKDGVKGSARSIEAYNMFEELNQRRELLNRFGGHPMAAGLSLDLENVALLRERLNNNNLSEDDLLAKRYIDLNLPLEQVSFGLIEEIKILEPYGKGNPKPLFGALGVELAGAKVLGKNKNVLKLSLLDGNQVPIEAMLFSGLEDFEGLIRDHYGQDELSRLYQGQANGIRLDLLYYPSINEFMGRSTLQVILESYRISK